MSDAPQAPTCSLINARDYQMQLDRMALYRTAGKITKSLGLVFEAVLPEASVGSLCRILKGDDPNSQEGVDAEVIGFREKRVVLMPYEEVRGVHSASLVTLRQGHSSVLVGQQLLGRVFDGRGMPIDAKKEIDPEDRGVEWRGVYQSPSHPLTRKMIERPLDLGIRSINGLLTCGTGQRMGIMAGSGVGKSVLLGMMARNTSADVNVIALIGERGREVREFIEKDLGEEGLRRSVVIVATSDKSPLQRVRAAFMAATVAEFFRDQGKSVLLMMDSLTRFCMAQREIGLSMGEPPASKGYTPSVFSLLAKLLERSGTGQGEGSVTGLYTVLVEGDDMDEPVADAARSVLDGHIVLSRAIAQRNRFPAVDVLASTSRVMTSVASTEHVRWAAQIREWIALYQQVEDLINIGAYVKGNNAKIDQAVFLNERIDAFLRQGVSDAPDLNETLAEMLSIIRAGEAFSTQAKQAAAAQQR